MMRRSMRLQRRTFEAMRGCTFRSRPSGPVNGAIRTNRLRRAKIRTANAAATPATATASDAYKSLQGLKVVASCNLWSMCVDRDRTPLGPHTGPTCHRRRGRRARSAMGSAGKGRRRMDSVARLSVLSRAGHAAGQGRQAQAGQHRRQAIRGLHRHPGAQQRLCEPDFYFVPS